MLNSISVYSQAKFFEPDGYYFPEKKLSIAKLQIDYFTISTLSYYNNNKLDYDHPKFKDKILQYSGNFLDKRGSTGIRMMSSPKGPSYLPVIDPGKLDKVNRTY